MHIRKKQCGQSNQRKFIDRTVFLLPCVQFISICHHTYIVYSIQVIRLFSYLLSVSYKQIYVGVGEFCSDYRPNYMYRYITMVYCSKINIQIQCPLAKGLAICLMKIKDIVEAPLNYFLNFDVCVVWWYSDGPINSQEYKSFWNLCGLYQDIYDWISPLNKRSGRPFYSNTAVYGEKWVCYFWSLVLHIFAFFFFFFFFEALNGAFEVQFFQGLIFTPYQRHCDSM